MPSLPICVQGAGGSGVKWVQRVRGQVTQRSGLSVVVWGGLWPPPWPPETCSQACSSVARVQFPCLRSEIPHPRWLTYSRDLSPLPRAMHPLPIQPIQGAQIPSSLPSSNFPFSQQPEKATCSTSPLPSTRVGNGVGTLRPVHRDIRPQQTGRCRQEPPAEWTSGHLLRVKHIQGSQPRTAHWALWSGSSWQHGQETSRPHGAIRDGGHCPSVPGLEPHMLIST